MAKSIFQRLILFVLAAWMAAPLCADVKIKTKNTAMGYTTENTVYIRGQRERREMCIAGTNMVTILQCDKNREIQLNLTKKTYMITPTYAINAPNADKQPASSTVSKKGAETGRGGVITLDLSSTDTGEREKLFGYTARHIKSSMSMEASSDACAKGDVKIENDGWYADLSPGLVCRPLGRPSPYGPAGGPTGGCQDRYSFHSHGYTNTGYPLKLTTTIDSRNNSFTTSQEVTELSKATLDPDLFEIPEGYTEAKNLRDFMDIGRHTTECQVQQSGGGEEGIPAVSSASGKIQRKKSGIIRVGVPLIQNDSSQKLDQMRDYLIEQIKNAALDPVPVDGSTPAQLIADAKAKDCDYILYVDITSIKGSSAGARIGGIFGVGSGKSTYDVNLAYKLNKPNNSPPLLDSTEESSQAVKPMPGVYTALEQVVRDVLKYIRQNE